MKVDLLEHNQEAYGKIKSLIAEGKKKLAISHATGTGKSYLIAKLFEDYCNDKKLVLVPSRYIKEQIQKLFEEYDIENADIILYQKLIKMSNEDIIAMDYDVIALDEYHHDAATKVWGEKVDLLISSHPESIIFGTSATPVRTDGVNAIDTLFEGNCASDLPLSDSIAKKIVPLPKYVGALYTLDDELEKLRKKVEGATNSKEEKKEFYKKINAMRSQIEKSYGMPIILNKHIKDKEGKYIIFCKNKRHLNEIRDTVIGWFHTAGFKDIHSYVVHSSYEGKDKEYKAFCDDTSHTLKLLFCVDMLNEGLHLENISGVLLLRPTNSSIVWHQQIGRAIEANNVSTPVIIDAVNNFSSVGQGMELLKEIKDAVTREKEGNSEFDDSDFMNIDTFFVLENVLDIQQMFKEIEGRLEGDWENGLKHFDKYVREHDGDVLVPLRYKDEDGFPTGSWASCRRRDFKNRNLSDDKINKLNKRGFIWNVHKYSFEINMKALKQYKEREGDCDVPKHHVEAVEGINVSLGHWCGMMRTTKSGGGSCVLTKEMEEQLNQVEFIWDVHKYRFEKNAKNVAEYYEENGKYPSSDSKDFKIRRLGHFLNRQKIKMRENNYPVWKKNIIKKYLPNFSCERSADIIFDQFIYFAEKYKKKYGHVNIKFKDVIDDYNIGMAYYRMMQKNNLSKREQKKLKNIGVNLEKKFEVVYKEKISLAKEAVKNGVLISRKNQTYRQVNLYIWIGNTIKRKYKNGKLSNEDIAIIEKLIGRPLYNFFSCNRLLTIVDIVNDVEIGIFKSKNSASKYLQQKYGFSARSDIIDKRLNGKVTTPYKDRFMFYYASDEDAKKYLGDNKAG